MWPHLCIKTDCIMNDKNSKHSPIRLVRVVNPAVVPHPNIRGAGVIAHVTLVHLLYAAFCKGRVQKLTDSSNKELWPPRKPLIRKESISWSWKNRCSHIMKPEKQVLPSSVTRSASSTAAAVSVRASMSLLKLLCSRS